MKYLIDSDWVADALKGRPDAASLLSQLAPQGIAISTITYGEVYEGIYYGSDPIRYERVFRQFLLISASSCKLDRQRWRSALDAGTARLRCSCWSQ